MTSLTMTCPCTFSAQKVFTDLLVVATNFDAAKTTSGRRAIERDHQAICAISIANTTHEFANRLHA